MLRAFILAAVICASCGIVTSMPAETLTVNRQQQEEEQPTTIINIKEANDATFATTTTNTDTHTDTTITTTTKLNQNVTPFSAIVAAATVADQLIDSKHNNENINKSGTQQARYYHPAEDRKPRVIEEFNRHFLDGSYEYKYTLSNGVTRYEKSFWKPVLGNKKILARKGFYSHPLKNQKYLTVFYTADENGFLQDTAKYTNSVPTLPKHLDIPQMEIPQTTATSIYTTTKTTTTRKPKTTTTRKPKTTTTTWRPVVDPFTFNWIY
ncbi:uncharacterized protein ACRADG_007039 [Cochliomyia hominivorax]